MVDRTLSQGVQVITRRGRKSVVVIAFAEYERLTGKGRSLSQFLLDSPLAQSELVIERDASMPGKRG